MKTINDINFKNKKALIRVDFNVPLNSNFEVTDATRIVAAKPTIIKILEDGGSCILMSHLGRPKGPQEEFSLKHIINEVEEKNIINCKYIDKFFCKDLTETDAVKNILSEIKNTYNHLDCIVNNAALQICKPIWELTETDWDQTYNCNVKLSFLFIKYPNLLQLIK